MVDQPQALTHLILRNGQTNKDSTEEITSAILIRLDFVRVRNNYTD